MKTRSSTLSVFLIVLFLALLFARGQFVSANANRLNTAINGEPQLDHWVYLPLISGGLGAGYTGADVGARWLPYILPDTSVLPTYRASLAVDSNGGIHVAYSIYAGTNEQGLRPATYAFCAANCASKNSWIYTHLGDYVQEALLGLTPTGKPRILLFGPIDDPNWPRMRYQYAACDFGCTNSANWSITTIATPIEPTATREYDNNRYFALDKQGHPAFIYTDTNQNDHPGTFYLSCEANCTDVNQWTETVLSQNSLFDKPSLAFSPSGQPRLAFGFSDENVDLYLSYAQCDENCTNSANWFFTTLVQIHGTAMYNLAVDTNGRPRLGVYSGSYTYGLFQSHKLFYLWCDSDCAGQGGWFFDETGMSFGSGDGVDLVLDGQNRPRLSFENSGQGLGYAWCNTNCESDSAIWQSQEVESQASLANDYDVLPIHRCTVSTWFNGQRSSLALDPLGNPRIAYDAQHWWYGTEMVGGVPKPCNYQDVTVTRVSFIKQP